MTGDRIELRGGKYVVLSQEGRVLGTFETEAEARERLRQIEAAKAAGDSDVARGTSPGHVGDSEPPRVERGVRRYDRGKIRKKPRYDEQTGFLEFEMSVTKAPAVFKYKNADGTICREFRPSEHVFSDDNIERMRKSTITLDHPPVKVTSRNVRRFSVGHSDGSKSIDDGHFWTGAILTDDDAISALKEGKAQTSAGYDCDLLFKPGVWVDAKGTSHPYEAVQTNHRHNHTALVDFGRAETTGASLDRMDAVQVTDEENMADKEDKKPSADREDFFLMPGGDDKKGTINVGDIALELPIEQAKLIADALKADKAKADTLEAERDKAKSDLEAANEKLKNVTSEEDLQKRVDAKRELLDKAATFVTDKDEFNALKVKTDDEIKRACIVSANPAVKLEDKSETYVEAMFDLLQPQHEDTMSRTGKALLGARSKNRDDGRDILTDRIHKAMDATDNAHRQAIPGGMTADGKTGSRDDQLHG